MYKRNWRKTMDLRKALQYLNNNRETAVNVRLKPGTGANPTKLKMHTDGVVVGYHSGRRAWERIDQWWVRLLNRQVTFEVSNPNAERIAALEAELTALRAAS